MSSDAYGPGHGMVYIYGVVGSQRLHSPQTQNDPEGVRQRRRPASIYLSVENLRRYPSYGPRCAAPWYISQSLTIMWPFWRRMRPSSLLLSTLSTNDDASKNQLSSHDATAWKSS